MHKIIAKPNFLPVFDVNIKSFHHYIWSNCLGFYDLERFFKECSVELSDNLESSIGEWILDRKNWINGKSHDFTDDVKITVLTFKEDFI